MKIRILALAVVALFLAAFAASAQTGTWTAVGSTGTVDPTQIGLAAVFGGTSLGLGPASGTAVPFTLVARFNVTNTYGGGVADIPPWRFLQVGAIGTAGGNIVTATLYQVDPCTGQRVAICTANNTTAGSVGSCVGCAFPAGTINFGTNLYYVEVMISRGVSGGAPQLTTLRIF